MLTGMEPSPAGLSRFRTLRRRPARLGIWLLALCLALPGTLGWLQVPMGARAGIPAATEIRDATSRLLADLAVLCTPFGLRLDSHQETPSAPPTRSGHDICLLCNLPGQGAAGVLGQAPAIDAPYGIAAGTLPRLRPEPHDAAAPDQPRGRGPPN